MSDQNIVIVNKGLDPLINCNFMLRVEGFYDVPCRKVRTFTKAYKYEYIQEGGLNDYVHMRRRPANEPYTFQVERYAGTDYFDPLPNGAELILPVILFVSSKGDFLESERTYLFTGCTVTGKEYGELNAEQPGLLTETATIAYREMFCLEIKYND